MVEGKKGAVERKKKSERDEKEKGQEQRKGGLEGRARQRRWTAANSNGSTTRGGSRAIVLSRFFISSLSCLPPPPPPPVSPQPPRASRLLSSARAREAHIVGFIVFELDASLLCFVSCAIRGANCRSYAIVFCFLLLPPSLRDLLFCSSHLQARRLSVSFL